MYYYEKPFDLSNNNNYSICRGLVGVTDSRIEQGLAEFISGAKRIAVLGIGNDLRRDDGLGPSIVNHLETRSSNILIENVGSVPEAFAHSLTDFGAERVIMIDAADMGKEPGHTDLVTKDRIDGIALSTHSMPLSLLMMYLEQETGAKTILLGVQPASIAFGEGFTPIIERVSQKLISTIDRVLHQHLEAIQDVQND
jgi:hydrogenase 3 maturation protease